MKKIFLVIITSILILSSCGTVRDSAGVNRKVIDEYSVIENPPLVIPPDFNLLPPEQISSKDILDTDNELAKEILFGLEDTEILTESNTSLINEIINETEADEVDDSIRDSINEEFAGEKSSTDDETIFNNEDELNKAIIDTEDKNSNNKNQNGKKEKKKKRFFFF
tara:strand:+ start:54 stop:551 length:498 start_codon:yes stop_codon:yes gene_type:complete